MMKKTVGWGLLILFFMGFIGAQESKINWITEYPDAMKLAEEQEKPVLIFFHAPWSQPSSLMISDVWELPNIVASSSKFVCVSINVDTYHYDTNFGVKTYPTVIFADPSGNEIFRRTGFISEKELFSLMQVFPTSFSIINQLKKNIEINSQDIESLHQMAQLYSRMRVWDMSSDYYKEVLKLKDLDLDEGLKDIVVFSLAMNQLRLRKYEEAEKALEEELKESPKGKSTEKILYGLFVAKIGQRKIDEAEKVLKKLKSKYPDSNMTKQAEKILESMKDQKNLKVIVKEEN
jgi:tetratricopeptide (TPR) repeat protein